MAGREQVKAGAVVTGKVHHQAANPTKTKGGGGRDRNRSRSHQKRKKKGSAPSGRAGNVGRNEGELD